MCKHKEFDSTCHECKDTLITKQKSAIEFWKDAWAIQREATGNTAWEIPNPFYLPKNKQKEFLALADKLAKKIKGEAKMKSPHRTHTLYLRDKKTIKPKAHGGFTRGTPLACLMKYLDKHDNLILYAFAVVHPRDRFVKKLATRIVSGRLKDFPLIVKGIPATGHEITKKIMFDIIERSKDIREKIPLRLRQLAFEWLERAVIPRPQKRVLNTVPALPNIPTTIPIATRPPKDFELFLNPQIESLGPKA